MNLKQIRNVMAQVHERRYGKVATNKDISSCWVVGIRAICSDEKESFEISLLWPTWRGDFRVHFVNENSCTILDITRPRI